jgi:hypothetical protein
MLLKGLLHLHHLLLLLLLLAGGVQGCFAAWIPGGNALLCCAVQ